MRLSSETARVAYAVIEQAAERVVVTDRQGVILYVNPAFTRLTGYSPIEAIGQTPRLLKSGQHSPQFYRELWSRLLSGRSFQARFVNRRKSGELYYEEQTITPFRDKQGDISHFVSTATDLSREVELKEAVRLAKEAFERLQEAAWDREDRMVGLKQEVNALLEELGRAPRYLL